MGGPAEPELTEAERLALAMAVKQFNCGLYFKCHETLEEVWSAVRGPSRDFLQGLIQVSVGFHHLYRGNRTGAFRTFTRAIARFDAYPPRYMGFDLAAERDRVRGVLAALSEDKFPGAEPPSWRLDAPADT